MDAKNCQSKSLLLWQSFASFASLAVNMLLPEEPENAYSHHPDQIPSESLNPAMIRFSTLTSTIRRIAPNATMLQGDVCPGARIFGGYAARGRAP